MSVIFCLEQCVHNKILKEYMVKDSYRDTILSVQ